MNDNSETLPESAPRVDSQESHEHNTEAPVLTVRDEPIQDHVQEVDTSSSQETNHISNSVTTDHPPTADIRKVSGEEQISVQTEETEETLKDGVELLTEDRPQLPGDEFVVVQFNDEEASSQLGTFKHHSKVSVC
jgi:hypothetical protein